MQNILNFIEINKDNHLSQLIEFLKFKSISTNPEFKEDIKNCANWLSENMKLAGLENVKQYSEYGNPLIYADWLHAGENKPTVLFYGHYDVQPVDPIELWDSPPFEPTIKDGKIFARGTADDKGQVFTHIKAVEAYLKTNGNLPINVKFIIEGEEESGGEAIEEFIHKHSDIISCDYVMISDTEWYDGGNVKSAQPSICYSLRGIAVAEITLTGPNRDLHSGTYGGAIDNPINTLCWMIAQLHDKYGRITIPHFYDDVIELNDQERTNISNLPFNLEDYKEDLKIKEVNGEIGYSTIERATARPTLDINGIYGGYIEKGHKSIIPSHASAKISMRIVANQDFKKIIELFKVHLQNLTPPTMKLSIKGEQGGNPVITSLDSKAIKACTLALKKAFDKEVVYMREGGSIPIVELFQSKLNASAVMMGLGLSTDNIHSPNENFSLNNFFGGIRSSALFLEEIGK
jgi:acetylornithine deacetylase/succinyl-diaminopimelate desuccinylase-like protein